MLPIEVEITGAVGGIDCSMFSQTADCLPPLTAYQSLASQVDSLLRLRNASMRWRSVTVVNPLHARDAYVSRDTTTARKTACRPISVMPWCRTLSLITGRICSDADRWLVMVTPRIFSTFSRDMSGSGCGGVTAVLRLKSWNTNSLLSDTFSLRLFDAAHVCMLSISCWNVSALLMGRRDTNFTIVAGLQYFQVGGCNGVRCWSNARTLDDAGWNARRWWPLTTEHSAVSTFTKKVNYPVVNGDGNVM